MTRNAIMLILIRAINMDLLRIFLRNFVLFVSSCRMTLNLISELIGVGKPIGFFHENFFRCFTLYSRDREPSGKRLNFLRYCVVRGGTQRRVLYCQSKEKKMISTPESQSNP